MNKIGIAGPVLTSLLVDSLDGPLNSLPEGLVGASVTQLVRGLLAEGYHVSVYTLDKHVTQPVTASGDRLKIYWGPFRPRRHMRDFMKVERSSIKHFIEHDQPDLVHAHWTYEFALGALESGWPTLITVRDWAPTILRLVPDLYRLGRLLLNTITLLRGKHFVAVSPYIQERLQRHVSTRVPVIPNALEDTLFAGAKRLTPTKSPVVISVNNGFCNRKNVHVLLKAFQLIRRKVPDSRLRLIGTGFGASGEAERWARNRTLTAGVEFVGYIPYERVLEEIEAADLLIHSSLEESFGMTLLEAMAKGTPVIGGAKSGAVPWVLNYGKAGVTVDVTSPDVVAHAGISLLSEPRRWRHFSEAGFAHARDNFRLSWVTGRYIEQYNELLAS